MENPRDTGDIFHYLDKRFAELMAIQKQSLDILDFQNRIAMHGLEGIMPKRKDSEIMEALHKRIRDDRELRHPHVKILNYLAGQFDYENSRFEEVNFSKVVRECRIGKNKAKEYLDLLIGKGLIESRTDGYRVFYRVKV